MLCRMQPLLQVLLCIKQRKLEPLSELGQVDMRGDML